MSETTPEGQIAQLTPERALEALGLYDPDLDFRKLAAETRYFSKGFRLVSKEDLIGIPHIVTSVIYRPGFPRAGTEGDYASVEAVIADAATLNAPQVRHQLASELTVFPNEPVVYNDSGTGVRRTFTELFTWMGLINPGSAARGLSPFDKQYQLWDSGADLAATGIIADGNGEKFRYLAMRGLRRSDYESEYGPATTYYIG